MKLSVRFTIWFMLIEALLSGSIILIIRSQTVPSRNLFYDNSEHSYMMPEGTVVTVNIWQRVTESEQNLINVTLTFHYVNGTTMQIFYINWHKIERVQTNLTLPTSFLDMTPQEFLDKYGQIVYPDENGIYRISWNVTIATP